MRVPARRVPSGTIGVDPPGGDGSGRTVVYVRVSSPEQRPDLGARAGRVGTWCVGQGVRVDGVVSEVGSGMNGWRHKLARLLRDREVTTVVVEHRDRLARVGVEAPGGRARCDRSS